MNRKLTKQEKEWLMRGLKWLETGQYDLGGGKWTIGDTGITKPLDPPKDAAPYLRQIDELRVVYKCKCGDDDCHTIRFQYFERGKCAAIVANSIEDGRMLIIDIHKETRTARTTRNNLIEI